MLEPYTVKIVRTVLRGLGGSDAARLPGAPTMRIFYSTNSDPMILDSVKNLNAIHSKLMNFVASPKERIRIEAVTYGNPEPYSEFLPYIELSKNHGEVKVQFGEKRGLIISGSPANLAKYIEAFQFDKDDDGNHHHPDFSLKYKGNVPVNALWPFIEADNDYVAEHK